MISVLCHIVPFYQACRSFTPECGIHPELLDMRKRGLGCEWLGSMSFAVEQNWDAASRLRKELGDKAV